MRVSGLVRVSVLSVVALSLALLAPRQATEVVAGDEPVVTFSPSQIEVLDGSSATVTVTILKQVTQEEIDAGQLSVSLIVPEFGSDPVIEVKEGKIPQGAKSDSFQTVTVSFKLECKDGLIEGVGEASTELAIALEEGDEFGAANATCTDGIAVNFAPDPLEIENGSRGTVTASITKTITQNEKLSGEISVKLVDEDSPGVDDTIGTADITHGGKKDGDVIKVSHTFTLRCENNEVQGADGESTEGESDIVIALEFSGSNINHGNGQVYCTEKVGAVINSHGDMPAEFIVDESQGLLYAVNAGGPGIDVFTLAGDYQETLILCDDQARTAVEPASILPPCGSFQGLGTFFVAQILSKIFVSDFQRGIMLIYDLQTNAVREKDVLSGPRDVVTDHATGRVYVANFNLGTVTVIDGESEEIFDEISTGGAPNGLAIDAVDGLLYVSDFVNDQVTVIDLVSGEVLDMISVGDGPDGIEVDEDGYVWVSNLNDGTVTVLPPFFDNGSGGAQGEGETIAVGGQALALAINPLTDNVFVANYADDTVSVIDRLSREVTDTLDVGDGPNAVGVAATAGMVYVGNHEDDTITPISDRAPIVTQSVLWGDDDCSGGVGAVDALKNLQEIAALPYDQTAPCFDVDGEIGAPLGLAVGQLWGDVDCDGDVDSVDALAILRWIAGLDVLPVEPCPGVGDSVAVLV